MSPKSILSGINLPHAGIEVEVLPGATITLESSDPEQCRDPRFALAVLALGQHMQIIRNLDQLLSSALHVVSMQQDRVELLESRCMTTLPPYEHAEFVAARIAHLKSSVETMRNEEIEARDRLERMRRDAEEAERRFSRRGEA